MMAAARHLQHVSVVKSFVILLQCLCLLTLNVEGDSSRYRMATESLNPLGTTSLRDFGRHDILAATRGDWETARLSNRRLLLPEIIPDFDDHSIDRPLGFDVSSLGTHFASISPCSSQWSKPLETPYPLLRLTKTGTTIVGVTGRDCVVLAADARATSDALVADAACRKLHALSQHCWMAGAGTAAHLYQLARSCRARAHTEVALYSMSSGSGSGSGSGTGWSAGIGNADTELASDSIFPSVHVLCHWLQSTLLADNGRTEAALIVGGLTMDRQPVLRAIHPHGSMDVVDRVAMGSGGLAALAVLESNRPSASAATTADHDALSSTSDLSTDEAVALAVRAVQAGMDNDLGSGSYVDVCVIATTGMVRYTQQYTRPETLEALPSIGAAVEETNETDPMPSSRWGANGFGNRPYTIRSQRTWRVTNPTDKSWNDILG